MLIGHCFEQCDLLFMMRMEFAFVIIKERVSFGEELLANHNQVETHEDGELYSYELKFGIILTLINEVFDFLEAIDIVTSVFPGVHI